MTYEEHRDIMARLDLIADRLSSQMSDLSREVSVIGESVSVAHNRISSSSDVPDRLTRLETTCRVHRSAHEDSARSRASVVVQLIATVGAVLMSLFAVLWKR